MLIQVDGEWPWHDGLTVGQDLYMINDSGCIGIGAIIEY